MAGSREEAREARLTAWSARITYYLSRFMRVVSRHWLLGTNLFMGLYIALPLLSPVLYHLGYDGPAQAIQTAFRPFCHQRPERSYFLFGEQPVYAYDALAARLGVDLVPPRFVGAEGIGYKVAICERDVALYGTMFLAGVLFTLVRSRLRPLRARQFLLFVAPLAVDGLGQLFGLWTSTWVSRTITGALFGVGGVWLVYPYLEQGMGDVYREMSGVAASTRGGAPGSAGRA